MKPKQSGLGLQLNMRHTRKAVLLGEMERVVPWSDLLALIEPHAPRATTGRPPFAVETMPRIHFFQQWFGLSDVAMEEALFGVPPYRGFVALPGTERIPDRVSILRFGRVLETHHQAGQTPASVNAMLAGCRLLLKTGTAVDATLIAAPSSTKTKSRKCDPEMHQTQKGNQWHFGMKAHIGVDAESGLVYTVTNVAANVGDVTEAHTLLHGEETAAFATSGYTGVAKREENRDSAVDWYVAAKPSAVKRMPASLQKAVARIEHLKSSIRSKVELPFRVVKRQFGFTKVRYRGLSKNTAHVRMLVALSNLWVARRTLMLSMGYVRPQRTDWPRRRPKQAQNTVVFRAACSMI